MLGRTQKLTGLSIEQSGIRYVRLANKTKDIEKQFFLPFEPGVMEENQIRDRESLCTQLKTAVTDERLKGTEVFLSVPPSQMVIRKLSVPTTNGKQLQQLIQLEVETGLHLPFEHPVYDSMVTSTGDEETEILVFATPREVIQMYVDVVEEAGLKVAGVEISGTALSRLITLGTVRELGETMLIQLEASYIDVYMFREGHLVFMRTLSLYDLTGDGGEISSLKLDEISAEIARMLNFYQYSLHDGEARIEEIIVTGQDQYRRKLVLELNISLPEILVTEEAFLRTDTQVPADVDYNNYRLAAGAALKPIGGYNIDLFPREDKEALYFPYVAMILVGILIIGVAATGSFYIVNQGKISNQEQRLTALQEQRQSIEDELRLVSVSGLSPSERKEAIHQIREYRDSPVSMLKELEHHLPERASLRNVGYTYGSVMEITLHTPQMEQASEYLTSLREMSFVKEAMIANLARRETNRSGAVQENGQYTAVYQISLNREVQSSEEPVASGSMSENQEEMIDDGTDK
ncbi:pilus assembly protein PilM [Paenibacillus sp. Marseille-Q7038]